MIARTSSSAWVRGVVEMFAAEGIDVEALFRDARLDIATLRDPARRFSIDDVPAGTYALHAWHERLGVTEQSVTVGAGETAVVVTLKAQGG